MKIAVCVKSVPDPEQSENIQLDPVTKTLIRNNVPAVINKCDKHAMEEAVRIKEKFGGEITVISMGAPQVTKQLKEALAMGGDRAFLASDRRLGGADSLATSYTLAKVIEQTGPYDLILCGNESSDGATSHVASQLGEWLGVGHGVNATAIEIEDDEHIKITRKMDGGYAKYRYKMPCVISCNSRINEVRLTSIMAIMQAGKKPCEVLTADDIENLDEKYIGLAGSPSQNGDIEAVTSSKNCEMIEGEDDVVIARLYDLISKEIQA